MKIVKVSSEVFEVLWKKLLPMERVTGSIPHPAVVIPAADAIVLLDSDLTVEEFSMPEGVSEQDLSLQRFRNWLRGKGY